METEWQQPLKSQDKYEQVIFIIRAVDVTSKIIAFELLQSSFALDGKSNRFVEMVTSMPY